MSASRPRTPSFLRDDNDPPTYDFRRMDYYLVAGQGFEPEITVFERTVAYIEQLPSYVMTTLPNALPTAFELEVYLSDASLAQAYYFRTGQPDQHQAWRQDWLRTCFVEGKSYSTIEWSQRPRPRFRLKFMFEGCFEETEDAKDLLWIFSTASGFGTGPLQPKRCSITVLDVQLARPTYMYMWVCSYIYIYISINVYTYITTPHVSSGVSSGLVARTITMSASSETGPKATASRCSLTTWSKTKCWSNAPSCLLQVYALVVKPYFAVAPK